MTTAVYTDLTSLKAAMNKVTATDDAVLTATVSAVSRAIDAFCNRPDGFVAEKHGYETARYFPGSGKRYQWIDECVDVATVEVKDSPGDDESEYVAWVVGTVGVTDDADVFFAGGDPDYPDFTNTPFQFLMCGANGDYSVFNKSVYPSVKVKASWGYSYTVPSQIKQACIMQSARWYKLVQGAMARATAGVDMGALLYPGQVDPDVKMVLQTGRFVKPATGRR
jgi:hypothetical protein